MIIMNSTDNPYKNDNDNDVLSPESMFWFIWKYNMKLYININMQGIKGVSNVFKVFT